ncbi:MAG TPA: toll/interleukin-1 receptor domain-containing protein [Pyrinomonadaceae bacterium]|jgi:hypothetical protein
MAIIFINYRRSDSSGWTRGLHERLADGFGAHSIFYDVDDITIGENFVASVIQNLSNCRIMLTVIGPNWLNATNADGTRRLDHPDDHVRREIEMAMQRNLMIIPVLVGGAAMPSPRQLPPSIAALSTRNALSVSDSRFSDDMERLIRVIQSVCGTAPRPQQQQFTAPPRKKGFSGKSFILGSAVALIIGILGVIFIIAFFVSLAGENGNQNSGESNSVSAQVYCDAFNEGVNTQMMYGMVNPPPCVPPEDLSVYNNQQIICGGLVNGRVETARLQGDSPTQVQINNLRQACLAKSK